MKPKEFYDIVGGDYKEALGRIQSDELIVKFLMMLPSDKNIEKLDAAMKNCDSETVFRAVHTLKGIALNLSLNTFADTCCELMKQLKSCPEINSETLKLYENVKSEYKKVTEKLSELCE